LKRIVAAATLEDAVLEELAERQMNGITGWECWPP
jgi:hypothetical protein